MIGSLHADGGPRALTCRQWSVPVKPEDEKALLDLEERLRTMLPEEYHACYEEIRPVSMGSAGLKYEADGKVAWDQMWATFCDLAMGGGPPHKGMLLEPAAPAAIEAEPERYATVVDEIRRGIGMVTGLEAEACPLPGWVSVTCPDEVAAEWLMRGIVMENVAAMREEKWLALPAGPAFRIEKEIKNVVTVIAKTFHYWSGHMFSAQHRAIGELFATLAATTPLATPAMPKSAEVRAACRAAAAGMAERIQSELGLRRAEGGREGWLAVECPSVRAAVWLMRALVVSNVLARREGTSLCLPVDPWQDPGGERVVTALRLLHGLAAARGVL
jgi:hypothetical protein